MEVSLRCHNSSRRNVLTGCGWRHAPEARGGLCENLKKSELRIRHQTRRIDFWSSQARGELAPYGGLLELGANWIRQHRRLCLSSLRRNLLLKVNKKVSYLNKKSLRVSEFWDSYVLYMFYRNQHSMSISPILHMALFVYMAMQQIEHSFFDCWLVGWLVGWIYDISTFVGYLTPNHFLCK